MINGFEIKIARYCFSCPICGTLIKCGESYAEDLDGDAFCVCVLPSRTLVLIETIQSEDK